MIGVFDSGFGGLTVLRSLKKCLPTYDYVYLGDNARAPYGEKSQAEIYDYACQATGFLYLQGCELVIFACNTASTKALRLVQTEFLPTKWPGKKVLGVLVPVVEEALTFSGPVGVIGTKATIDSGAYCREIKKICQDIKVIEKACPLLVPLVEKGCLDLNEVKIVLAEYLAPLRASGVATLILGCTHYPLLAQEIKEIMGTGVKIIDSPAVIAKKLENYLERHPELDSLLSKNGQLSFFTTDDPDKFNKLGSLYFGQEIKNTQRAGLKF